MQTHQCAMKNNCYYCNHGNTINGTIECVNKQFMCMGRENILPVDYRTDGRTSSIFTLYVNCVFITVQLRYGLLLVVT